MKITITPRNIDLKQDMRSYFEQKADHLSRYFDGIIDVHSTLYSEKLHHVCEVTVHGSGFTVHAEENDPDLRAAIDKTLSKVESQVKKYKDRLHSRRKSRPEGPETEWTLDVLDSEDLEAAEPTRRVIRSKRFAVKPMSLDEAVMQLDLIGQDFLVFRDSDTQRVNVLYRRRDGHFGLIEPQF